MDWDIGATKHHELFLEAMTFLKKEMSLLLSLLFTPRHYREGFDWRITMSCTKMVRRTSLTFLGIFEARL